MLDRRPGIAQALHTFEKLEQQPATLAFLQAGGQQGRSGQALFGQLPHASQFALKMPGRLRPD
ncbi:hypothetical protein D3C78_1922380 [compost metagenome]